MAESLNLQMQRSDRNVWDPEAAHWSRPMVDEPERWLIATGAGMVAAYGLSRRSIGGALLALIGGGIAVRAASGYNDALRLQCWARNQFVQRGWCERDIVHETSEESFPTSDAPSWTPTTGTGASR
jgi:hypothetical protein